MHAHRGKPMCTARMGLSESQGQREISGETKSADILMLDFQPLELLRIVSVVLVARFQCSKLLLEGSPIIYYIVLILSLVHSFLSQISTFTMTRILGKICGS